MSYKIRKTLAAAFLCIGGAVLVPQQILAQVYAENASTAQTADPMKETAAVQASGLQQASDAAQAGDLQRQADAVQAADMQQAEDAAQAADMQRQADAVQAADTAQVAALEKEADTADGEQAELLPAPEAVEAVKVVYNAVTVGWNRVEGAAGYQIEYALDNSGYTVAETVEADVLTYKIKKLLTGTEYQIRVCALDENGMAGEYTQITAQPYLNKTKITSAEVTNSDTVSLEWKKVAGADKYQLFRKVKGESYKLAASTAQTSYVDKTVQAGQTYFYSVRAVRKVNGKNVKAKLSAKAEAAVRINQVQALSCEALGYQSAKLTWQQADAVTGYYIYRSTSENGTYRKIKTVTKNTTLTYTDKGIVPGKKFYYKICTYVQAADKTVELGELSAPVMIQTQAEAPVLTAVNTNVSNRSLALAWEKAEDASGYRIYRSKYADKGFTQITELTNGTIVGYEDRAVAPGGTYYYRMKAIYQNKTYKGLSGASNVLQADVAPSAPIGLTIRQTATDMLDISWQESNGAVRYNVYRSDDSAAVYTCIAQGVTENHYTDSEVNDDQKYFYRVSAVGAAGEGTKCLPVSYHVGGVSLNTRTLKLCVGVSKPLVISTFRQGQVIWRSDDTSVAVVDSDGMVTGIDYGTAKIIATVAGKSAEASVSVTPGSKNGIDVSRWQEDVDWQRVKNSGVEFAFLRISNHYLEDYTFETKYQNAFLAGMPLGVYCYSRAATVEEAREEARTVLKILNGRKLDYPIALDMEDAVHKAQGMTKAELHQMILAFKQEIEDAGYRFVLYSYLTFLNSNLDRTKLDGIDLWIARYRSVALGTGYSGTGNVKYWQYNSGQYAGSDSRVDGITDAAGNLVSVDVNIEY